MRAAKFPSDRMKNKSDFLLIYVFLQYVIFYGKFDCIYETLCYMEAASFNWLPSNYSATG